MQGLLRQPPWQAPAAAATGPIPSGAGTRRRRSIYALNQFDEMVPRCDLCLTVSGTATLHVAAFGVPMIVVYRVNPLMWHLAAGVEQRRGNVSEVWAWLGSYDIGQRYAGRLFGDVQVAVMPELIEQTPDEVNALLRTMSFYARLSLDQ